MKAIYFIHFCFMSLAAGLSCQGSSGAPRLVLARSLVPDANEHCDKSTRAKIQEALRMAGNWATLAARIARTDRAALMPYFGPVSVSQQEHVADLLDEVAEECRLFNSGRLMVVCDADEYHCPRDGNNAFGYVNLGTPDIHLTPSGVNLPLRSSGPGAYTLPATIIHEISHALAYTDDVRYGRYNYLGLSTHQTIDNADTYAWFAVDSYYGYGEPPSDESSDNEYNSETYTGFHDLSMMDVASSLRDLDLNNERMSRACWTGVSSFSL